MIKPQINSIYEYKEYIQQKISLKLRIRLRHLFFPFIINIVLGILNKTMKKKKLKDCGQRKWHHIILIFIWFHNDSIGKLIQLINIVIKAVGTTQHTKPVTLLNTNNKHSEREIKNTSFTIAQKYIATHK